MRFDDLNAYFVEAIKNGDKGYFGAFIRTYEPVLQSRAERFVSRYDLSADDAEDIKQIFLETLWFAFLDYDAADPIPLLQYVKKAAVQRQLDYIRTTKNACTVPTQNRYAELRKVMRIYNGAPELSADARIALAVKETGFAEKKVTELVAVGKACEYPVGIVPTEENEKAADGTVADELIEDPSVSLFEEVLRSIYRDNFCTAANKITPKDKQILSLSLGVCFDCFGVFKPSTYAEIALKQGASGEKSIEKNARQQSKNSQRNCAPPALRRRFLKANGYNGHKRKRQKNCTVSRICLCTLRRWEIRRDSVYRRRKAPLSNRPPCGI